MPGHREPGVPGFTADQSQRHKLSVRTIERRWQLSKPRASPSSRHDRSYTSIAFAGSVSQDPSLTAVRARSMWQRKHDARRGDQFEEDQFEADSIAQPLLFNSGFGIGAEASVPPRAPNDKQICVAQYNRQDLAERWTNLRARRARGWLEGDIRGDEKSVVQVRGC